MRQIDYYNLDAIISVGYRVNSVQATRFRQELVNDISGMRSFRHQGWHKVSR